MRMRAVKFSRGSARSNGDPSGDSRQICRYSKARTPVRRRTGLRSPWNVDSGSASAPTVAEAGMADEPAVVAGAGITEECVDAVTQARAMLIRHEAAEIVEAAGMRETLTSRQGCHA